MAGAGAKLFVDGTILDAVGINTYLMDQAVMRFASTAARDAAFGGAGEPVLAEGMFAYTNDTNTLWFYTGSAWEVATIKPSLVDAKGDLIAGTAADTVDRLAVGTNGQVLVANSSASTGLAWALPRVLQVVSTAKTDTFTTSSTSFVDVTGLSVTITPQSATSQILVFAQVSGSEDYAVSPGYVQLVRGATNINLGDAAGSRPRVSAQFANPAASTLSVPSLVFLDSPATTTATTYKIQVRTISGTVFVNRTKQDTDANNYARAASTITVMEISA
jgi:hypothetical protein